MLAPLPCCAGGIEASFTHEEIKDLVFHSNAIELLSDLTVLERVSHNSTVLVPNSSHGVRAVPLLEWYKEPVMKLGAFGLSASRRPRFGLTGPTTESESSR